MYDLNDPLIKQIIQARTSMLFRKPFFGNLAVQLDVEENNDWCKTAATDGRKVYFNRKFVEGLTKQELIFLIAHEILHCIYDHLGRRGSRDPGLWNMANDYIVNYTLVKEGVGTMPKVGLYDNRYTDEMSSEEVYDLLKENQTEVQSTLDQHLDAEGDDSDGGDGGNTEGQGDDSEDGEGQGNDGDAKNGKDAKDGKDGKDGKDAKQGNGDGKKVKTTISSSSGKPKISKKDLEKIRNEVRAAVIRAAQSCSAGDVPAGIRRLISELTEPKLDWRTLLEMHIQSAIKDDYTFRRPNRRSWTSRAILPGQSNMDTIDVVAFIDSSGSISNDMLKDFLSEIKGIMELYRDFTLHVATFDTKVYNYKRFGPDNLDEINEYKLDGGGGTQFECMYDYMKKHEIEPMKMVVFTDGYPCGTWGEESYCPDVLWIIHSDPKITPPFGTGVLYEPRK